MKFKATNRFKKSLKRLARKHKNITEDILKLKGILSHNPITGISLGAQLYKLRLNISKSSKGKRGGFRLVYFYKPSENLIVFLDIYSKAEKATVLLADIKRILIENNFLDME